MPNRLAQESSPYLLQHSLNPVDWFPWGEEAFQRARSEDKPVLLSIGYSACHWCHVMEHESFENEAIAGLMNENFINIKVDREERPDLDHIYMQAIQALTNSGGWPLTIFLTPDAKPFYGGTYFPPEDRHNLPGFPKVLKAVVEAYHNRRSAIEQTTAEISAVLSRLSQTSSSIGALSEKTLKQAYAGLMSDFDRLNGGFGGAPKFPQPMTLEFLLRYFVRYQEKPALEMVEITLHKMAQGGIYDQIGGGFHRYATDNKWLVPHFEKMLYDNALLSRLYLQAYQATREQFYAEIAIETLDYLLREMHSPECGFYSTQDADSEGEEGKYYLWTSHELEEVLGNNAQRIAEYFGVVADGNYDGLNILHQVGLVENIDIVKEARRALLSRREHRVKPARDEKILASWNGLALISFAEAAAVLNRSDYLQAAIANGNFLLNSLVLNDQLFHVYKDGRARLNGFLEDYALVIEGLLALHRVTADGYWLKQCLQLNHKMLEQFYDERTGLLYDTGSGQQDLIIRPRNDYDGAVPAGTSAASDVLLEMAVLTGDAKLRKIAEYGLQTVVRNMEQAPLGYSQWLNDLDFYLSPPQEIVIVGRKDDPQSRKFIDAIYSQWRPNKVLAAFDPNAVDLSLDLPVFQNRLMVNGQPAVYICRNYSCLSPVTEVEKLEKNLEGLSQ